MNISSHSTLPKYLKKYAKPEADEKKRMDPNVMYRDNNDQITLYSSRSFKEHDHQVASKVYHNNELVHYERKSGFVNKMLQ